MLPVIVPLTVRLPVKRPSPTTWSLDCGALVPMPTFVSRPAGIKQFGLFVMLPRTRESLAVTQEFAPIAVALVRLLVAAEPPTQALLPRAVLSVPVRLNPPL